MDHLNNVLYIAANGCCKIQLNPFSASTITCSTNISIQIPDGGTRSPYMDTYAFMDGTGIGIVSCHPSGSSGGESLDTETYAYKFSYTENNDKSITIENPVYIQQCGKYIYTFSGQSFGYPLLCVSDVGIIACSGYNSSSIQLPLIMRYEDRQVKISHFQVSYWKDGYIDWSGSSGELTGCCIDVYNSRVWYYTVSDDGGNSHVGGSSIGYQKATFVESIHLNKPSSQLSTYCDKNDIVYCSSNITKYQINSTTKTHNSHKLTIPSSGNYRIYAEHNKTGYVASWMIVSHTGFVKYLDYKVDGSSLIGRFIIGMKINDVLVSKDGLQKIDIADYSEKGVVINTKEVTLS